MEHILFLSDNRSIAFKDKIGILMAVFHILLLPEAQKSECRLKRKQNKKLIWHLPLFSRCNPIFKEFINFKVLFQKIKNQASLFFSKRKVRYNN